jgi:hypothetical protein
MVRAVLQIAHPGYRYEIIGARVFRPGFQPVTGPVSADTRAQQQVASGDGNMAGTGEEFHINNPYSAAVSVFGTIRRMAAGPCTRIWGVFELGRKDFFSEEKKQKTFGLLSRTSPAAYAKSETFFGSFFQKRTASFR